MTKLSNINGKRTIKEFVDEKMEKFQKDSITFETLFDSMFSEESNIIYERMLNFQIEKTTYKEAKERIIERSNVLSEILSKENYDSLVGLYLENSLDWIIDFWAILMAGFRPVLLNMRLSLDVLNEIIKENNVVAVITNGTTFDTLNINNDSLNKKTSYKNNNPFGLGLYVMSSGTTSKVKLSLYTAKEFHSIVLNAKGIIQSSKAIKRHYDGELKQLTFLPFYHIFGLVAVYTWFAFFSRTFVELKDLSSDTLIETIVRHKVTHIFAVPLFFERVYQEAIKQIKKRGEKTYNKFKKAISISRNLKGPFGNLFRKLAFKEVRNNLFGESISMMITGGASIDRCAFEFFNLIGYNLSNGYGMTEIGITSVELSGKLKDRLLMSIGKPFDSIEYRINENDELEVKGSSISKETIVNGNIEKTPEWFNTHDIFKCVKGRYYCIGRTDDLIIDSTGENLNPNLYEESLKLRGVLNLSIIKDKKDGKPVLLIQVSKYISKEELDNLRIEISHKLDELELKGRISRIFYTITPLMGEDDFKINRIKMENMYSNSELTEIDPSDVLEGELSELSKRLVELFSESLTVNESDIKFDSDFFNDLGGTSLDYFVLENLLKKEFGIKPEGLDRISVKTISEFLKGELS